MDRKTQNKQQRRWSRNPSFRKNSPKHNRRQQWWRTWTIRNKMDKTRLPTQKHRYRSFLRSPRKRKMRKSWGDIRSIKPTNRTKTYGMRYHLSRWLQCKTKNRQRKLQTGGVEKWKNPKRTHNTKQSTPCKHRRRPWDLDPSKSKNTNGKVSYRSYSGLTQNKKRNCHNDSRWRRTPKNKREKWNRS